MANTLSNRLESIRRNAGVRGVDIAEMLDTTPQTVSRWQTGQVEPHSRKLKLLLSLEWLADQLHEFYEPADARLWLYSPHKLLEGDAPADRIRDGRIDDVLALLNQLRDGAIV